MEQVSHIITLSGVNELNLAACSEHKQARPEKEGGNRVHIFMTPWIVGSKAMVSKLPMIIIPSHI